ncbi:MAG TPA: hypothetical protein P5140_05705 [Methanofastidiosum sp.]|nr:hypothetical protein [Methanofastidiosum sp.]
MIQSRDYGSFWKAMNLVGRLTTVPLEVEFGKQKVIYTPPQDIQISKQLFRSAKCQCCGKCCSGYSTNRYNLVFFNPPAFLDGEYRKRVFEEVFKINGVVYPVWIYRQSGNVCDFSVYRWIYRQVGNVYNHFSYMDNGHVYCYIHSFKPVHCLFPPIFIDSRKDKSIVLKRPFSRNWQFGCKVQFLPFDYQEFVEWDLHVFEELKKLVDILGLSSFSDCELLYDFLCKLKLTNKQTTQIILAKNIHLKDENNNLF